MNPIRQPDLISVEDYLESELRSPIKHEYLGGVLYAMAGGRNAHNKIATNALVSVGGQLRGRRCRPFNSDTKIRIRLPHHVRFYYPDLSVACRQNPDSDSFQDDPIVLVEVLSQGTRRTDEGEKKDAYLSIPSLAVYLLIEQDCPLVVAFRRTGQGFVREIYQGYDGAIPLPEIDAELALADLYEGVVLTPEVG